MSDTPLFQSSGERAEPEGDTDVPAADTPLFQNMDDQDTGGDPSDLALGVAALGLTAGATGGGSGGGGTTPSSPGGGAGPAIAASAIGEELRDNDEERARD